jgi:hypothetical protein
MQLPLNSIVYSAEPGKFVLIPGNNNKNKPTMKTSIRILTILASGCKRKSCNLPPKGRYKNILTAMALLLLSGSCAPTRNVYWEITDAYAIIGNGEKIRDIPAGVPLTICVEVKKRTGPLNGPGSPERERTKGKVMPIVFTEEGKKFKGGLDTLKFDITLDRKGKGYIHNVVIEYEPDTIAGGGEMPEAREIAFSDSLSAKLRQITREEYETGRQASAHLRHEPYKEVKGLKEMHKMLRRRLKVIDKEVGDTVYHEYEITHKDGNKTYLDSECDFIAYYPELETLLFHCNGGDRSIDLNNSAGEGELDPQYCAVSPDRQWRINGSSPDDVAYEGYGYFLEKWNSSKKKYEFVGDLFGCHITVHDNVFGDRVFPHIEWYWTGKFTAMFEIRNRFYRMEII